VPKKKTAAGAGEAARAAGKKPARRKTGTAGKTGRGVAPSAAAAATPAAAALRVKQIRSGIGHAATYRRTLEALGLKYHQHEVVVRDHPAVRGMLRKVWNLVSVRPVEG
jgi:ribosomal protein L30